MPDKRQTSKQRRAARNRAQRDALAARRQNAGVATTRPATSSTSTGTTSTKAGAAGAGAASSAAAPRTRSGKGGRRPGDWALIVALGLSLVAFVLLLNTDIPIDDRGEALPATFGGLAMLARAALTDGPIVDESQNIVSYYGAGVVALMAVPLVVVTIVFFLSRRWEQRNRLLTFAMLGLAGVVVLTGTFGFYYMPALIALAVASFQVRKVEMPTRSTQPRPARGARGRRGAIDVDAIDDDDDTDDEPEVVTPAPSTRSRRSGGGRSRRATATSPAEAGPDGLAESYEDGDVYDPDTGVRDDRAEPEPADVVDLVDAEVVDEPAADEGVVGEAVPAVEPAEDRPAPGRARGGLRRRSRPTTAASAGAVEPDATPVVEPAPRSVSEPGVRWEVAPTATNGPDAAASEATEAPVPSDTSENDTDDILAELEEELRLEAEADEDDDPPTSR